MKKVPAGSKDQTFQEVADMLKQQAQGIEDAKDNESEQKRIESKNVKIMEHLETSMNYLVDSGQDFNAFHDNTKNNNSDKSSIGSIESAEIKDMELLLNGEIEYRF